MQLDISHFTTTTLSQLVADMLISYEDEDAEEKLYHITQASLIFREMVSLDGWEWSKEAMTSMKLHYPVPTDLLEVFLTLNPDPEPAQ
tara:strand:+ start:1592 stop:1855 length:264 start_codon:yes stop_codon:yes gene_type:complete